MTHHVRFDIHYAEYTNDDLPDEENDGPDCGWYITGELPDETSVDIGPSFYGPGCPTVEEALAIIEKWAKSRPTVTYNIELRPRELHREGLL